MDASHLVSRSISQGAVSAVHDREELPPASTPFKTYIPPVTQRNIGTQDQVAWSWK
jgi:hypothetical protein